MRASLSGSGQLTAGGLMSGMLERNSAGLKATLDEVFAGDRVRWEYVLSKVNWPEHARRETHETLARICLAVVPMSACSTGLDLSIESGELWYSIGKRLCRQI